MKRKKVLLFIDWYLPGYKAGGPVTSCANMINALKEELEFYVVTRNTEYCETTPYQNLAFNTWVQKDTGEFVMYLSQDQLNKKNIEAIISEFDGDVIYINGIYSKYFSVLPLRISSRISSSKKIIVASRGMLALSAINVKKYKKKIFLGLANVLGWYKQVTFHATNQKESEDIKRVFGEDAKVIIASNIAIQGVNNSTQIAKKSNELLLISLARIAPEKNILFLLKQLKSIEGKVTLNLFGQIYNEQYWKECQKLIEVLPMNIAVHYKGMIDPQQINDKIQAHHLLVLPSLGENYGHVIAESFMAGRPVLISDQTPWQKLEKQQAGYELSLNIESAWVNILQKFVGFGQEEYDVFQVGASKMGEKINLDKGPIEDHLKLFLH